MTPPQTTLQNTTAAKGFQGLLSSSVLWCISVSNTDWERVIGGRRKKEGSQEAHDMSLR